MRQTPREMPEPSEKPDMDDMSGGDDNPMISGDMGKEEKPEPEKPKPEKPVMPDPPIMPDPPETPQGGDPNHGVVDARPPLADTTPAGRHAFTFTPDDIPDDEEPTGLVRHLISGEAREMPVSGPLRLTWSLDVDAQNTLLDTQPEIDQARADIIRALKQFSDAINVQFTENTDPSKHADADIRFSYTFLASDVQAARAMMGCMAGPAMMCCMAARPIWPC